MQQRSGDALKTELRLLGEQNARQSRHRTTAFRAGDADDAGSRARSTADQAEVLEHLRGVLRQAGPYVRRMVIQRISTEAAQIFGDLMQDHRVIWRGRGLRDYAGRVNGNARQFASCPAASR
ncbi:MAG: hypothetical protein R2851_14175 [Caldilineaceae bacterium]